MLILTRRIGEVLVIGDNIKLTVLGVRGHQVRLGIDAPKDVQINREEVVTRLNNITNNKLDKKIEDKKDLIKKEEKDDSDIEDSKE